jgi:adenosine deaminase
MKDWCFVVYSHLSFAGKPKTIPWNDFSMKKGVQAMNRQIKSLFSLARALLPILAALSIAVGEVSARESLTESYFKHAKTSPVLLREFLFSFPKGGELHTHLDGAIYAENYIRWAAEDGKCIDLSRYVVAPPPCGDIDNTVPVADVQFNPDVVNAIIDAFSIRNYQNGPLSGHDQFFSTFGRYLQASEGRQGFMLAEVTARAARQNVLYLEIMQSYGMHQARTIVTQSISPDVGSSLNKLMALPAMDTLVADTIKATDKAENQWREALQCKAQPEASGCVVTVRYLAQVIRGFPLDQVLAQTILAFKLIEKDPRYVGLNFVAPEDAPMTLRDYSRQMEIIRDVAAYFPTVKNAVTLHAGELAQPLVTPEALRNHIRQAVQVAGAKRIGHGVDIVYEDSFRDLLASMAAQKILVEINLTSNAVILGIEGDEHPFELYRSAGVPLSLSTDDEGVSRIDLTHEYVRASQTYDLGYAYLKELSRNALAYSFLPGPGLFSDIPNGKLVEACSRSRPPRDISDRCRVFLTGSEKAQLQWQLEDRFALFEARYN